MNYLNYLNNEAMKKQKKCHSHVWSKMKNEYDQSQVKGAVSIRGITIVKMMIMNKHMIHLLLFIYAHNIHAQTKEVGLQSHGCV